MNINLHIERLILDEAAVNAGEGAQVQSALIADLTQRLQGDSGAGDLPASRAVASVQSPSIQITNRTSSKNLGRKISQAVYRGIKP